MTHTPRFTALASSLSASVPFVGPEAQERARKQRFAARLGANENIFGPSPQAIAAMQSAASEAWMYADPESHDLRMALAEHHRIKPANVMIDAGIDTLLGVLVRLLIGDGDAVVTSAGAYPTFNYHVAGFGGELHQVSYNGDHEDPDALIEKAIEVDAKLIYFANPDNPMGSFHNKQAVERFVDKIPDGCLLILDEAYVEFAPKDEMPEINPNDPRVIRMRTFSKAYGLAGARVGYAIGAPDIINAFNKVRNHFGMCRISQAGALAALSDQAWLQKTQSDVDESRKRIARLARQNGLEPLPSATNFVAIDCGSDGVFAQRVLAELIELGLFVRMPFVAPQNRCIRISCGTMDDLDLFEKALPIALERAKL
jgi:histidinol-phosphate aminotransferase